MTPSTTQRATRAANPRPLLWTLAALVASAPLYAAQASDGERPRTLADATPVVVDAWSGRVLSVGDAARCSLGGSADTSGVGDPQTLSTSMCLDNSTLSGLVAIPPGNVEVLDWGIKNCQGTGLVTRLGIGYETRALDPAAGGPGAEFAFAVYQGTTGFGVVGTERARFTLSGLPGAPTAGSRASYSLFLDFGNVPLVLSDGNIGWGFEAIDGETGPLLAVAPDPSRGIQDLLDLYSPAPATPATYIVTAPPFPGQNSGSIAVQFEELEPDPPANTIVDNGSGVNPLVFSELQPALIGDTWVGEFDLSGFPTASITVIGVSEGPVTPFMTPYGELLVNTAFPGFFVDVGFGLHAQPVLPRVTSVGRVYNAQGVILLSPGLQFTNALVITAGF